MVFFFKKKELKYLPRWLSGKESTCHAGDPGSIPGSERSSGGGNGNPLQCSGLGNPMDTGAWWAPAHRVAQSGTRRSDYATKLFLHRCVPLFGFLPLLTSSYLGVQAL